MKNKLSILSVLSSLLLMVGSCHGQMPPKQTVNPETAGQAKITLPAGVSPQTMFRCSLKDKAGNLWFGTTGAGVYRYDGKFFTRYAEKEGLANTFVVDIAQDIGGNIWVATSDGVFHEKAGVFNRLEIPASTTLNGKIQAFCILADTRGNAWFGTEGDGLWKYDRTRCANYRYADKSWMEVTNSNSPVLRNQGFISALLEDKNGNIWFSSSVGGLNYYDGKTFHTIDSEHANHHTLDLLEDRSGNIWMATRLDGVCRFDGKRITSFTAKDGVNDNMASCLYESPNGDIWLGSLGRAASAGMGTKGLTIYNGKTFTAVSSAGMRNNEIWTIVGDNAGNIWIGTKEFGLFRYDGKTYTAFTVSE